MARSGSRLAVFAVLVASMITVLLGRTVQLQAGDTTSAQQAAQSNRVRTLTDIAARGLILDQAGRPLAANRQVLRVVVDRNAMYDLPADGEDVVRRLAAVLGTTFEAIDARLTLCSSPNAVAGRCWDGSAPQEVPVASDVAMEQALPIIEQPRDFPAVAVQTVGIRSYPGSAGERAGHLLGYLGSVTQQEIDASGFSPADQVGRGGLEQQYDAALRGTDGSRTVAIDTAGRIAQTLSQRSPVAGSTLITSLDAQLQAVVEQQLAAAVQRAVSQGLPAQSGAAVVVDVTAGRVLAMASYPDYSPSVFLGPLSEADYRGLQESGALLFTPVQGTYAPGSTFKPFTVAGMAEAGYSLDGSYSCPSSYSVGGSTFSNYESRGYGTIPLQRALEVSCNTVFYAAGADLWAANGGEGAGAGAADPISAAAGAFGLGRPTGIDLPGEAGGLVSGRAAKYQQWLDNRAKWCAAAEQGYPELSATDPQRAGEYTALDAENCRSGGVWRQGDAINAAIGQGLTAITPLQLAMAYAAIANGGTLFSPQVAKALVAPDGSITEFAPKIAARVPLSAGTQAFLSTAMQGVTSRGTASGAFAGFPLDLIPVASKTGSAQVSGKASTSWFASFAPADQPRYAVVMMVAEGGTGAQTSAPSVRAIYESLFGITGNTVDAGRSVLVGGAPGQGLPDPAPGGGAP